MSNTVYYWSKFDASSEEPTHEAEIYPDRGGWTVVWWNTTTAQMWPRTEWFYTLSAAETFLSDAGYEFMG
jgi:hypothetical protein